MRVFRGMDSTKEFQKTKLRLLLNKFTQKLDFSVLQFRLVEEERRVREKNETKEKKERKK